MKILVKVGGTLLDQQTTRTQLAADLACLAQDHQLVIVHGGGKQMTRFLAEHGIESRFIGGLRVTDAPVIDALLKVVAGSVNKQFVSSLNGAGVRAVGISGLDGALTVARQKDPSLGFVGEPVEANGGLLHLLVEGGYLPVVACLAADEQGVIYNVNADQMAVSCAVGFGAQKLLFLTDVAGVRDASGEILSLLTPEEIVHLVESGVAHGGMQAKLEAAALALAGGIEEVAIVPGHEPQICERLAAGEPAGTKIFATPRGVLDTVQ